MLSRNKKPGNFGARYLKTPGSSSRIRSFETWLLLFNLMALMVLVPLRNVFVEHPLLSFAASLVLFFTPGALLSHRLLREYFPGAALIPVALAISVGIFGLLGIPALILHLNLGDYLWGAGAILLGALVAAAARLLRPESEKEGGYHPAPDTSARWLWGPFLAMSSTLAFITRIKVPVVDGDTWDYLAWIREFLNTNRLALYDPYFGIRISGISRVKINGWILEQAALSKISGIDPITLVLKYLAPTLVIVALLAFYALARVLLKSEAAALLAGSLYALFLLVHLSPSVFTFGGEFVGRIVQDKFLARYLFLPVALCSSVAFLQGRKFRYLALLTFLCWAVVAVHPIGLAVIGLSTAGFGAIHVVLNRRNREAWAGVSSLAVALLSILVVPVLYFAATGKPPTASLYHADIGGTNPQVLANMVFVRPNWKHAFVLGHGLYIMSPSLLLTPVIAAAYLVGAPFLAWRLKRSLAAQLLLGMLLAATVICYVPPIATFVGNDLVAPGELYRLAWPIPLAALLTIGWIIWEGVGYTRHKLEAHRAPPQFTKLLPLMLVVALMAAGAPSFLAGVRSIYELERPPLNTTFYFDPAFRWMQHNIKKPGVVMAPDAENLCIPAYSANLNVVSFRGSPLLGNLHALERFAGHKIKVPPRDLAVREFYSGPSMSRAFEILRRYKVNYVMVFSHTPLSRQLEHLPAFRQLKVPSHRYSLFAVNRSKLGA